MKKLKKMIWERKAFIGLELSSKMKMCLNETNKKYNLTKDSPIKYLRRLFDNVESNEWQMCIDNYFTSDVKTKQVHKLENYMLLYGTSGKKLYYNYIKGLSIAQKKSYRDTDRIVSFSHFFKEYWIEKGFSENESIEIVNKRKLKAKIKSKLAMSKSNNWNFRQKGYWIKKGYSEREAIDKVSKIQSTFSKEKCIKKHGKVKGLEVWKARQDKWQDTMTSKSPEEIAIINRKKISKNTNSTSISKVELELSKILKCGSQLVMSRGENNTHYVYDLYIDKKVIEYNGDYWHSNPSTYHKNYLNESTGIVAKDKWKQDKQKYEFIKTKGYELLVIWESEFIKNKEEVIKKCKEFFNG